MEPRKKDKRRDSFWRATRYLSPHWRLVAVSIVCALMVGGIFTTGLGSMLPIMQVLINGDSIQDWVNRKIVERRVGARFADVRHQALPDKIERDGQAAALGAEPLRAWSLEGQEDRGASHLFAVLGDPGVHRARVVVEKLGPVEFRLEPVSRPMQFVRGLAMRLPAEPVKAIAVVLVFLLILSLVGNSVRFFQEYYSEKAAILAVRDIRQQLYDHALHLPLGFFSQRGTSDVTHRVTQDAQGLQDGMKGILGNSIQEPVKAAMALGLALFVSWQLTLFIIVFAPVMFLVIKRFGKHVRRAAKAALQNSSNMLGQIEASLIGIRVVKAANAQRHERRRFGRMVRALVKEQLRIAKLEAFNTPALEMMTLVVVCCIVLYASWLVLVQRSIDTSIFFLVMACLMGIGESLRKTTKINNILQKANAAASRLFEVIDLPTEMPRTLKQKSGHLRSLPPIARSIEFDDVTFTYPGAQGPALRNVSLTVEKGKSVAVVGRNGSGKTTLLALLPRFYDPDSGAIRIDGVDIREASFHSLRKQIGIVTQDSVIFPGTIADNIAYANPRATREQIEAAARRAFAHDFILQKPQGYDTVLGEHGAQLSGGQKQRICIARAILRETPILILDEATSQVDAESEALIQQAIEKVMHERTTFIIAHRFATIRSADLIVVMDQGQVVGQGTHERLLATCPTYLQLYERQFVGHMEVSAAST